MGRLRASTRSRARVRIGALDGSLTGVSGMAAVTELVEQLGVIAFEDLHVLACGAAGEQPQPAEHRATDQVQQPEQHGP